MNVRELQEHLARMIDAGKGDFEVVYADGNGKEKPFCGFEVVEQGFFSVKEQIDKRAQLTDMAGKASRERPRLRMFTHSPF